MSIDARRAIRHSAKIVCHLMILNLSASRCQNCKFVNQSMLAADAWNFRSELLGYPVRANAYFIRCHDCLNEFRENPTLWESWREEFREVQRKLKKLEFNDH